MIVLLYFAAPLALSYSYNSYRVRFPGIMRKRLMFGSAVVLLGILVTLVVWQGSFNLSPAPSTIQQTYLFWAVSTLIFILTVRLGFILFRTGVKLYIERQSNRPGLAHQIQTDRRGARAQRAAGLFPGAVERLGV